MTFETSLHNQGPGGRAENHVRPAGHAADRWRLVLERHQIQPLQQRVAGLDARTRAESDAE